MFSCLLRNNSPLFLNKKFSDYCRDSRNESIRRLAEKNKPKIKFELNDNDDNNNAIVFYEFIFFITFTSLAFYLYKRLK
jgi:hypothetical protein